MSPTRQRTTRLRWARWLLATAIFGSTMAIGAMHVIVLVLVAAVLLASAVLAWMGAEPLRARTSATLILWTCVGLTAWTALSVVPLPASWLALLSPHTADVWARCLTPLGLPGPAWTTLSLDPVATRVEVLRGVTYALAFVAASRIAARREGVVFLERALMVTGVALALAAIIHPAVGADKVFGLYAPRHNPGARHVAPILNSNVLSGYLNIGLAIILGHLLTPRPLWPRSVLAALALAIVGTQVWVASRGGVVGMVLAVVLVAWMSRAKGPEESSALKRFLVPGLLAFAGIAMTVVASSEGAMGELATAELSKLDLIRQAFRIVPHFPVFGVGRGAFESVFPAFRSDSSHIVYTHPENFPAQWATEWGLVPALVAFVVLLLALRPSSAMARSPRAAGAWSALAAVAVQNLVDFGSEYPAVVIALTTCAAIVTGGTSGVDRPRAIDAWSRRPFRLVAVAVTAFVLAVPLVIPGWHHDIFEDRTSLRASALDASVGRASFETLAEAAMLRHPAEPYLPFAGALRAARTGDASVLPWVERTLERAIVYGPAHLVLARWIAARSPGQARLEYRLTLEQAPELGNHVRTAVDGLVRNFDDATELIPTGPGRDQWIGVLSSLLAARLPATAQRLDALRIAMSPTALPLDIARRRASEALVDVLAGDEAPWCDGAQRAACLHEALARAAELSRLAPNECDGFALHARLLLEAGEPARALKELRAATDTVSDRTACFEKLAQLALLAKADDVIDQALHGVTHAGCPDDAECVRNLKFVAELERARGRDRSALGALQRAEVKAPEDDALKEEVATLASKVDLHAEALHEYQALALRHPGEARWATAVAAEKLALVTGGLPK